jgi:hypothetical protein
MRLQYLLRPLPALRLASYPPSRVSLIRNMSVFSSARLQDKVVLVTGASAGIGAVSASTIMMLGPSY